MAMLSLSLLLQPSLLASGIGCGATLVGEGDASDRGAPHVMASMAGDETMPMDMAASAPTDPSDAPAERCDTPGSGRSCDGPNMPDGCAAMGSCASPPLVTVALVSVSDVHVVRARMPEPLALPSGIDASPDSLPPRA
ncbi:MAG: hypothetical protein IPP90_05485 [Gemmatimonadaceae bacterium]|nr:hypothetical protein [Gemmatimonadaceae bacterium]